MNGRYYELEYEDSIHIDDEGADDLFGSDPAEYYDEDLEGDYGEGLDAGDEEGLEDDYSDAPGDYDDEDLEGDYTAYDAAEASDLDGYAFEQAADDWYPPDPAFESAPLTEALREAFHESYLDAPEEALQDAWADILDTMTPAEGFNFNKALRQIGKTGRQILRDPTVGQIARTVLPAAGATIGTIYGGPMGGALGGQLGQAAGQVFTGGKKTAAGPAVKSAPAPAAKTRPTPAGPASQGSPQAGSAAAAQLLQLTQDPNVLKSLLALALGARGRKAVTIGNGGPTVNLGSYMNLLGALANRAAADAHARASEADETSSYLLDAEGEFLTDPSNPEARAMLLYEMLTDEANQRLTEESVPVRPWSDFFPFSTGTKLLVEYQITGPDPNIGTGMVLKRTRNLLNIKIHIDKIDTWGIHVPQTDVLIEIEYKGEGPGNRARIVVNGQEFIDDNVTIKSKKAARILSMSISILGQRVNRIVLTRVDSDEVELKFKAQGDTHVLVLSPK